MSAKTYTVEIPPIHYLLLGLETTNFTNEKPEIAKEEALSYLSKVLREAVEKEVIEISDFENEQSSNLEKITDLNNSIYTDENGNINFERILQCRIKYTFNSYILKNAVFNRHIYGSPNHKLDSYGFFILTQSHSDKNGKSILIKIKNEENIVSEKVFFRPRKQVNYFDKLKMQEVKELFFNTNNHYQKEIVASNSILEFERVFLSFLNTWYLTKYLFVPQNLQQHIKELIDILEQAYPNENKFEFHTSVIIEEIGYYIYYHGMSFEKITYSKKGKIFIRDNNGVKEVDEQTTFSEMLEIPTDDTELREIIKII